MRGIGRTNLLVIAVVAILFIVCGSIVVLLVAGRDATVAERTIAIIVALVAPTVSSLVAAIQAAQAANRVADVQEKVNGHLNAHMQQAAALGIPIQPTNETDEVTQ